MTGGGTSFLINVEEGPRFVSINHVDAVAAVYGPTSKCIKSANYVMMLQDHLQTLRDPEKHKHRRTMWDRGLNAKGATILLNFTIMTDEAKHAKPTCLD